MLPSGALLQTETYQLESGAFTNSYDLSYGPGELTAQVRVHDGLHSVGEVLEPEHAAAASGGFFFLADRASGQPRQLALNLAMSDGVIRNLPVADREAVLVRDGRLFVRHLRAVGNLLLNDTTELTWAGSLTNHDADCRVYASGNAVIVHRASEQTGSERVLVESSRYTPPMMRQGMVDVGFRYDAGQDRFVGAQRSGEGQIDIFEHDFVLRMPEAHVSDSTMTTSFQSVDTVVLDERLQGALSVGPMLTATNFENHPINRDLSLGAKPPFDNRRMARLALYVTEDHVTHLRLFDGRPGSALFEGVTPREAAGIILGEAAVRWGCFLDPGQTAKLFVQNTATGTRTNYGNRHYLRWPQEASGQFEWVPNVGRPVASSIVLS